MKHRIPLVMLPFCIKASQAITYMFVGAMRVIGLLMKYKEINLRNYLYVSTYKTTKFLTTLPADPQRKIESP